MRADRFARLKELLIRVRDMPEMEQRAYLDETCKDDPDLLREAESLLAHHESDEILKTGGARGGKEFHRTPYSSSDAETVDPIALPGQTIGPYVLHKCIGSGGMGEVWRAEQTTPVRRTVALKLIKAGMDTGQVITRFEAERQAVALMDHPAIAKVFDAGTTPQGRPYFAMEYVPGVPITEYSDARRLGTRERLELFQRVCEGVQHAHQKAVIHRDLKPSNILVADVDGKPMPRIIDFGVAKATTQKLTEKTMYTAMGQLIGTPEYMSPEQADLTAEDVDTRTDVYSLGVILYELLAGALPFEATELRKAGFEGIIRLLREKDPPRPSTKVSSLGQRTIEVAQNRRTEPRRLVGQLRGDLDWIVMRSLEKDRNRRYGSPQELAQDIGRHLGHEPVLAGPPSLVYRTKKFIRRNRVAVGAAATIGLAVVLAFALVSVQNARIAAARDEAELVTATLKEMLASVDPTKSGRDVTVKETLDETAKALEERFKDQPLVEAELRHTVGKTYYELGETKVAEGHLERAVEILRETLGEEDLKTLAAMDDLAWTYIQQGRAAEAEPVAKEALEISRRFLGEEHPQTLRAMHSLGSSYGWRTRYAEAEPLYRRSYEISRRVLGEEHPQTLSVMLRLGAVSKNLGRFDEAMTLLQECSEAHRRVLGEEHPQTLGSLGTLAGTYGETGRHDEEAALSGKILEIQRRVLGVEHRETWKTMKTLAHAYTQLGRYDEAEALRQELLEISRRVFGDESAWTLRSMRDLGLLYIQQERFEEGTALLRETVEISRRVLGEEQTETLRTLGRLAWAYWRQGRYEEAVALQQEVLEIQRVRGVERPETLMIMDNLGTTYMDLGRYVEAEELWREQLEIRQRVLGGENIYTLNSLLNLGWAILSQGRHDEAEAVNRSSLEISRCALGEDHWETNAFRYQLACAVAAQGRRNEVIALMQDALDNGWHQPKLRILDDEELASLHGDPEFEEIVEDLRRRNEGGEQGNGRSGDGS